MLIASIPPWLRGIYVGLSLQQPPDEEPPMVTMASPKRYALEWIDEQQGGFSDFHQRIWNYAEPAWREYKSAKSYCELL